MVRWTKSEFLTELDRLGYRVDNNLSFGYTNNLNRNSYKARSIYIREKDSGLSFANIHARRDDNFKALQVLRFTTDIKVKGRVWEV